MERDIVLQCQAVSHSFGRHAVLFDINLQIVRGEIAALVGPSGCGKSTLLNTIIGTMSPSKGAILVTPANRTQAHPVKGPGRDRGIVYQQYTLFPFLTSAQNVALGLLLDRTSISSRLFRPIRWRRLRKTHIQEAEALLDKLKLSHAMRLYPHQMSGGMRQRVAIAQTLIMKPEILLLDEPFGALDEATREDLQKMLLTLYQENCQALAAGQSPPYTILIVTHELNEAIYVGDRVMGLSQYWGWQEEGFPSCPGATIVYDQVAAVETPEQEKDFSLFADQRREIRRSTFDAVLLQSRKEYVKFWDQVQGGLGEGVLA